MKKNEILIACAFISFTIGCSKTDSGFVNDISSFSVIPKSLTISVNDSLRFDMDGNPDNISFFSGEIGRVYEFRNRTLLTGGNLRMKFETRTLNRPADTLDVLISNDFSGIYDSTNVARATWKTLNNKLLFPTPTTVLGTFIPSGITPGTFLDITDSIISGQPFYLAYRYTVLRQNNIEWSVGKLGMYNFFSNGTPTAAVIDSANNTGAAFVPVSFREPTRWSRSTSFYRCLNTTTAVVGAQHFYISRALNPNAVNPDAPEVLKNISQSALKYFAYKFKLPGTYKIAFLATNARLSINEQVVKEFTITVQ